MRRRAGVKVNGSYGEKVGKGEFATSHSHADVTRPSDGAAAAAVGGEKRGSDHLACWSVWLTRIIEQSQVTLCVSAQGHLEETTGVDPNA